MSKLFILDTNVLLHDPDSIFNFDDNDIVIPLKVIEELDKKKTAPGDVGYCARKTIRHIEELRTTGSLIDGVEKENGGKIRVATTCTAEISHFTESTNDNEIIRTAQQFISDYDEVILVSKDVNLRIKTEFVDNLTAVDYLKELKATDGYESEITLLVDSDQFNSVYQNNFCKLDEAQCEGFLTNQFIKMIDNAKPNHCVLTRYAGEGLVIQVKFKNKVANIVAKNDGQCYAMDALLDPSIKLVTIEGQAGTGKTLITVAAALHQTMGDNHSYDNIFISKPILPVDGKHNDIGFLPGDVDEKLAPHYQSYNDSIEVIKIADARSGNSKMSADTDELFKFLPLTFLRGRNLPASFLILDEAQNCSLNELGTLISRAGEGTKIVLLGDTEQIDNPFLNKHTNGLSAIKDRFAGQEIYAHINLTECERSELAKLASELIYQQ